MARSAIPLWLVAVGAGVVLLAGSPALAYHDTASATTKTESNLRAEPNTTSAILDVLPEGTPVEVICWARGEPTYGTDKYGSMWLYADRGGWVHSFLLTPVDVDRCGPRLLAHPPTGAYQNCAEAIAAGAAPVYIGEPGYGPHLDRDRDGIGCEWHD